MAAWSRPATTLAAPSKNYRYSTNVQVAIDANTRLVIATGDPQPGNRNDTVVYRSSGIQQTLAPPAARAAPVRDRNEHRPHQGIANARPLALLPESITDPDQLARLNIHRRDRLGGDLHEYEHAA